LLAPSLESFVRLTPQYIESVTEPIDDAEVLRYLGYPAGRAPNPQVAAQLAHWIDAAGERAEPRAAYLVLPVIETTASRLRAQSAAGEVEFRGAIGSFLGTAELLIVFVATAGPGVEALATELFAAGEELAAMIANAVGAERAEAAEAAVVSHVWDELQEIDYGVTLPYSPGYCGMKLTQQRPLFDLFGGSAAGVTLTESCLMQPIKSVSGLVGLAPAHTIEAEGTPCDRCELTTCNMRR
jgi:hypothetical protein